MISDMKMDHDAETVASLIEILQRLIKEDPAIASREWNGYDSGQLYIDGIEGAEPICVNPAAYIRAGRPRVY